MSRPLELSMTVGELAYSMRISIETVKQAANARHSSTRLAGDDLKKALERLKAALDFKPKDWDLTCLDEFQGKWGHSLSPNR